MTEQPLRPTGEGLYDPIAAAQRSERIVDPNHLGTGRPTIPGKARKKPLKRGAS